jgi:hypothetical protein
MLPKNAVQPIKLWSFESIRDSIVFIQPSFLFYNVMYYAATPGSGDLFADGRGTQYSFNHVTAPYGLTLTDLVSYRYRFVCIHQNVDGATLVCTLECFRLLFRRSVQF